MFVSAGGFDEALLCGYGVAREVAVTEPLQDLQVAQDAAVYKGQITHGQLGTLKPAAFKLLRQSFGHGLVVLVIGWRHGAANLSAPLARSIQTLVILEPGRWSGWSPKVAGRPPAAVEQRLLSVLYDRAKAHELRVL